MRALSFRLTFILGSLAVGLIFLAAWRSHPSHVLAPFALATPPVDAGLQAPEPMYSSRFVSSELDDFVHSSSVTALPGGDLMAVWFAGSREGAADVQIRTARYDAKPRSGAPNTCWPPVNRPATAPGAISASSVIR